MKKKVTSLLLVVVMMLSMVVTAIPAYAADAYDTLIITSDKTEAYPGDEITYTVSIGPMANLAGVEFELAAPAGLAFKSGALVEGIQTKLGAAMCGFNAVNQKVVIVGGMDYTSAENTDILVVTYTVDADFTGELTLGVDTDTLVFINPSSEEIPVTVVNTESKVTVTERPVIATGITLNKTDISLVSGETLKLIATLTPSDSVDTVVWTSSDTKVATVAADGTVTAVAAGTAVITVKAENVSAECNVAVACSHRNNTSFSAVASTCTVNGNTAYTVCNDCGEIILGSNEKLPLDKYNHINTKKVDAVTGSCIENGHAEYVICNDCKTVISGSDAAVAGPHGKFVNKVDDKYLVSAADCQSAAVYSKSCELCGIASATEIFFYGSPLAHTYSDSWSKGNDNHWHECTECGDKKDVESHKYSAGFCIVCGLEDNHSHVLSLVPAVAATCTSDGNKEYYACSKCDELFEDASGAVRIENKESIKINALGHTWADATCTAAKTCTVCKATEGEALGHTWADATCTAAKTCTVCKATEGDALGHSWADATCTTAKTCTVCKATEGDALGHTWADATCTAAKTCTVCKATEGDALGHTWADATCTTAKTCTVCKATEGDALGHKWADATCTTAKTCTVCKTTEGKALGHSFGEWVTVKAATFAAEGQAERVCACGAKETKTLAKLPYLLGDADLNGSVNAADARIILRISAKLDTLEKHKIGLEVVDVNFDGSVSAADARIVLRVSAKLQDMPVKK